MNKSEQINELAAALVKFHAEVKPVAFDCNNPFFKSRYASLSALVKEATPHLVRNGLSVSQVMENETAVTTILMHTSGQWITSSLKLKPVKDDPQGVGSAITYARRYSYASILGLVSDEDDDGNAASVSQNNHVNHAPIVNPKPPIQTNGQPMMISDKQKNAIFAISKVKGMSEEYIKEVINFAWNKSSISELTMKQASKLIDAIQKDTLASLGGDTNG